jgi:hypothetical protein
VVFGSPRRLNLQLVCTPGTPARETLDVWPALPLVIQGTISSTSVDNIVVALGKSDRICRIDLRELSRGLKWDLVLAAMQVPFPALTDLLLHGDEDKAAPVIPDTFLGGSAPCLRRLEMECIPYPGISSLLLIATHLVDLDLSNIPHFGYYISPEAMATSLSALTRLHTLSFSLDFLYSPSPQRLPMTHCIFPDLKRFSFKGSSDYLDDFVAWIDTPRLSYLLLTFPYDQMDFDMPHRNLVQFIGRTPRFEEPTEAHVTLDFNAVVQLLWASDNNAMLNVDISYEGSEEDLQPWSIAQVFTMCLPPLLTLENLRLGVFTDDPDSGLNWNDDIENDDWLELLRPFTAVKSLYLYKESAQLIVAALQELIGSRITEVLPSLRNIFLEELEPSGPLQENIEQFVSARQLSGHPIAISVWDKDSNMKPM